MTMKNIVRLTTLAAAASLFALPASAQWGPEEEKNCFTKGEGGSVTLSAQGGNGFEDSSKLQQYETFPKGVFVPCANFSWKNDKDYFVDVRGTKLGLDDQFASLVGGKKGGFTLKLGWDQNPNWQSNTAQTPYSETRSGNTAFFHVPDGMRLGAAERLHALGDSDRLEPGRGRDGSRQPDRRRASTRSSPGSPARPRSTCATSARPAGRASISRWARAWSST